MSWWRRRWCKHPFEYIRNGGPWAGIVCMRCGKVLVEGMSAEDVIEDMERKSRAVREFVKLFDDSQEGPCP